MKTINQVLACCLLASSAMAQEAVVEGKIAGLPDGTKIYFNSIYTGGKPDSTVAQGGAFRISTSATEADVYMLRVGNDRRDQNGGAFFYMEPGTMKVSGKGPLLKDVVFAGPPYAKDLNSVAALKNTKPFKDRLAMGEKLNAAYEKMDTVTMKALRPEFNRLDSIANLSYEKWIDAHPASPVSAMLLAFFLHYRDMEKLEKRLKVLEPSAKQNSFYKKMQHSVEVAKATAIGKPAPEFTQNDTLGNPVSLKDFRGKYVLIDFWASWCVPCRRENPAVVKAFQRFREKNFTVLGVSLDREGDKAKWMKAIHDDNLTWTQVSDLKFWDNAVARQYDIKGIPANFLIDPQGKIIAKDLHGEDLERKLAEVLL